MAEKTKKILLVTAGIGEEADQYQSLTEHGFQLISAFTAAEIRMQCHQHDFDLVITSAAGEDLDDHLAQLDFPVAIPLLCVGMKYKSDLKFAGFTCCTAYSPADPAFLYQVESLVRIRNLYRQLAQKDTQLEELTDTLSQQQQSMKQHSDFLDVLATRDGLTGLYNRRHLNKVLIKEFEGYSERDKDLCLLLIDIDYFDELNKCSGRSYGDFILNDFAARLTSVTQPNGICFRFSGEVFVALLADTGLSEATAIAEDIRMNLTEKPFTRGAEKRLVTVSIGIASLVEHQPDDPDEFITMGERALFKAKSEGRDRLAVYQPVETPSPSSSLQELSLLKDTLLKILDKTRKSAIDSLQLLAREMVGQDNQEHINIVRQYVDLLSRQMNLPESVIKTFKNAITLHTSIRLILHSEMIRKQQQFTPDERELMNDFPYKLAEITELFDFFSSERTILMHHGERYDGTGYPEGLKGDEIPLGARLFSLVDALAAMNANRPYRQRLKAEEIVTELTKGAGLQFDPSLVIKALEVIREHKLLAVDDDLLEQAVRTIHNFSTDL